MTCPSAFRAATRADRMGATTVWGFVASGTCRLSEWQTPARPKTVRVERLCAPIPFVFCEEKTKPYNPYGFTANVHAPLLLPARHHSYFARLRDRAGS